MMSSPICRTQSQGITYSVSRPKIEQIFPGPGTISAAIFPHLTSISISPGNPRLAQVQTLMTSLRFNSQNRIGNFLFYRVYEKTGCTLSFATPLFKGFQAYSQKNYDNFTTQQLGHIIHFFKFMHFSLFFIGSNMYVQIHRHRDICMTQNLL